MDTNRHDIFWAGVSCCILASLALTGTGCKGEPAGGNDEILYAEARPLMHTVCRVTVHVATKAEGRAAADAAFAEMQRLIKVFNDYDPQSEISRLVAEQNKADPGRSAVSVDLGRCLAQSRAVWEASGGAFDPTIGPLVDFWRSRVKNNRLPTSAEAKEAAKSVGLDKVEFLRPKRTSGEGGEGLDVHFAIPGMRLDLGGIAKGYIAQRAAEVLQRRGISSAMIDTGGNIYCLGTRPDGEPWRIGIRDPRGVEGDEAEILLRISLEDQAVSTSAHYYRFFKIGRQRFSHIINPRTGWPVQETDRSPSGSEGPVSQSVASVTVVGADAGLCDGYSTAIAVMGAQSGVKMIDKLPGYECYVVTEDAEGNLVERRSRGFAALQARP